MRVLMRAWLCVGACVCACVHVCVRACVRVHAVHVRVVCACVVYFRLHVCT